MSSHPMLIQLALTSSYMCIQVERDDVNGTFMQMRMAISRTFINHAIHEIMPSHKYGESLAAPCNWNS
eukprot:7935584-Prorocentrum_lima.AAC.1